MKGTCSMGEEYENMNIIFIGFDEMVLTLSENELLGRCEETSQFSMTQSTTSCCNKVDDSVICTWPTSNIIQCI